MLYKLRIIVVEDEYRILNSIVRKINSYDAGCEVVATAAHGREALQLIDKHRPNVVITDIKMPVMDGLKLSEIVREKYPDIFVVILSGYSDFQFAQQAIKFGVSKYLLKPVSGDRLIETLEEIRTRLRKVDSRINNTIWISRVIQSNTSDLGRLPDKKCYYVFAVNFFNLCYDVKDNALNSEYSRFLEPVDWSLILNEFDECNWFVIDDFAVNRKIIIISLTDGSCRYAENIAASIMNRFKIYYKGIPINICYHNGKIRREDIWNYSKRLRNVLENSVIPAKPGIYQLEKDENAADDTLCDIASLQIKEVAKPLAGRFRYKELEAKLNEIFSFMIARDAPQRQVTKIASHIIKFLEYSVENQNGLDIEELNELEGEFFRILSISQSAEEIIDSFREIMSAWLMQTYEDITDLEFKKLLLHYVDENYNSINSMKEVASVFNYNYTYLSRMFKELTGTTFTKYITLKRIEAAKQIMSDYPGISIKLVGSKVGYTDQHYFSRMFKAVTGISPSEFKVN
ncbi:MAG: response regulator transcription factor [Caldicoprobacterales bacterium]|jgi:two-component system response regulator YesN|nr:response regulator [Clostridiales bacterium]